MPWTKNFDVDQTLDKAMRLFWARGFEATSMEDLVQGMGINRGSIYGTYGDKRKLFIAALNRYEGECRKAQLAALEQAHSPRDAIGALFHGWIDVVMSGRESSGCFLTNTALELAAHDEEIGAIVAAGQRDMEEFFCRLIEKGQRVGEIPTGLSPPQTGRSLLAALIGLLVLSRSRRDPELLKSVANGALAMLD
jgi:TetR/AcrR family transcriptional regulator, transcriptional repressor for nem operon